MNQHRDIRGDTAPKRRFSADEFEAMGMAGIFAPDERVELLAGEIYTVSPQGGFMRCCVAILPNGGRASFARPA